jgi:surface antigen/endonuclease/exonuclease/phosphatase family metal-dependent hydrolase
MSNAVYDDEAQDSHQSGSNPAQTHYDDTLRRLASAERRTKDGDSSSNVETNKQDQGNEYSTGQEPSGGLYHDKDSQTNLRSRLSRLRAQFNNLSKKSKAGIGGGILAGGIGLSSLFGLGSMQAIHLTNILSLDQVSNEQSSDLRMNQLFRYVRSGGNLGETRVTWLGSKKFHATVQDLKKIGVTFNTNETFGVLKGTVIELDKYPVTKNVAQENARAKLSTHFQKSGIKASDIRIVGNKAYIDKNLGISASRSLVNEVVSPLEGGKISTAIKTRQVKKFYKLPSIFHPFQKIDAKINKKLMTRAEAIKERKAQREGKTYESSKRAAAYEEFKSKTSGVRVAASGALLITGGTCMARSAADSAITYNREAVVLPQVVDVADALAIGAQQQSGQDFDASQLDLYNSLMSDPDGKSIWDAKAIKAKTDPTTQSGEELPAKYEQAFVATSGANTLRDLGGTAGAAACSPLGQGVQLVAGGILLALSLPTGGVSTVAYGGLKIAGGAAAGIAVMSALHDLISSSLKDEPIPDNIAAPVRGNLLGYASRELSNVNARASGGVELSDKESAALDSQALQQTRADFLSKPLFARIFDASDYRSLVGQLVDKFGGPKQATQRFAAGFANIGSAITRTLGSLIPSAHAASQFNYGFNRFGIPERILNNPAYQDPYDNAEKVAAVLDGDQGSNYIDRASKCFGVTITKTDNLWSVIPESDVNPLSGDYEGAHCNASNDSSWDRIMLFVKDSTEMEAAACYLGEEDSCKVLGASTEEQVCSLSGDTGTTNLPDWVKLPVVNASAGGPVKGNINVAIANIKEGANVAPSLRIMSGNDPDFILLNEVSETPLKDMEATLPAYGAYRYPQIDENDANSMNNVIMWKKDRWTFVDGGRVKLVDSDLTFAHGEPREWNRYAAWGIFKNDKGEVVPVIDAHMMTNPAKYPQQHGNPTMTRIQQYSLGMDILSQLITNLSQYGPVLVGGDMNSQPDQGNWSAVPKMKSLGYNYTTAAVIYGFYPTGTKMIDGRTVPIPIGDDHGGISVLMRLNMNGAGPGSVTSSPGAITSTTGCDDTNKSDGGDTTTPGSVKMQDDYARECGQYTACTGQCVDFVKFRLKKYIDKNKFDDFTTGTGGVAAYTSSENLGRQYGYVVNHTPAVNSVASWPAGGVPGSSANGTYGHVAMVSQVNADGSIVVEEYNATIPAETYSTRKIPASAAKLLTYAHTEVDFK